MIGEPSFILQVNKKATPQLHFWVTGVTKSTIISNVQAQALYFEPYLHKMAAATLIHAVLLAEKSGGIICSFSHAPGGRMVLHAHGRVPACCL